MASAKLNLTHPSSHGDTHKMGPPFVDLSFWRPAMHAQFEQPFALQVQLWQWLYIRCFADGMSWASIATQPHTHVICPGNNFACNAFT